MPDAVDFETQVRGLQTEISALEKEQVVARTAADKLKQDMIDSGVELRSLTPENEDFVAIDAAYRTADDMVTTIAQKRTLLERAYGWTGRTSPAAKPGTAPNARARASIGRRFTEGDAFRTRADAGAFRSMSGPGAGVPINLDATPIMTRDEFIGLLRYRAGLDLASGQAMVTPEFSLIPPVEIPVRAPRLLELISVQTTDSDAVVWGQQTERILAAAPTPSGTPAPQETQAYQRVTSMVRRIPVLLTVPKEVLADEGRLQGILDVQMMEDVHLTVENQVLAGDGTGENFDGILSNAGIGSYAMTGDDYILDALHKGITYVRLHLFQDPDAIGLNPIDLESIMLQKDNYGRYIFDPSAEQTSIWGFQAVSTPVFSQGTAVVGNWRMGATMWLREDLVVTATDGYTDVPSGVNYFSAGLVAILAQVRAAFAVERPFAFCEVESL